MKLSSIVCMSFVALASLAMITQEASAHHSSTKEKFLVGKSAPQGGSKGTAGASERHTSYRMVVGAKTQGGSGQPAGKHKEHPGLEPARDRTRNNPPPSAPASK